MFSGRGQVDISRFKGLGEMMPAQLKETTMDPGKRMLLKVMVAREDVELAEAAVERLMGNKAESRFTFISERAPYASGLIDI
jgi:topoisomerase IV subunit B